MTPAPHSVRSAAYIGIPLLCFCSAVIPDLRIAWLVPAVVMSWYRRPRIHALWMALACGLATDLVGTHPRFGTGALSYVASTVILYRYRSNFFEDSLSTFPILTGLFSACAGLLFALFNGKLQLSGAWIFSDLMLYPLIDAAYCAVAITLPLAWLGSRKQESPSSAHAQRPK